MKTEAEKQENRMKVGILAESDMGPFESLLLPEVVCALHNGEPIIVMGLVQDEIACGALAGYVSGGCFYVISLYVAPDYRRKGGAGQMIRTLENLIRREDDIETMELEFTTGDPDNETLFPFLDAVQFEKETDDGHNIYTFALGDVQPVKVSQMEFDGQNGIQAFSKLPEYVLHTMQKQSVVMNTPQPEQTFTGPQVERDLSYAILRDGEVKAYAVVDHSCCNELTLCALWVGDSKKTTLSTLLKAVIAQAQASYPPETRVAMQAVNDQSLRMIESVAPSAQKVSYVYRKTIE